jgi:uncharacterized protein (DUF2141 family)
MKAAIVMMVLGMVGQLAVAQGRLEVVVKNVKGAKGNVRVGVFKDEKTFLKEATIGKVVKAAAGEVTVAFENVPAGTYAVSVIHDENENGELDSGMFGIPKEGFGFANDAMGTFGPPGFEKASIKIGEEPKIISIGMKYM